MSTGSTNPAPPALALQDITIDFGEGPLLEHASLTAAPGDVVGIQGANGSGKTSVLRIAANVGSPAGGTRLGPTSCAYVPPTIDPLPVRSGDWLRLFPRSLRADPRPLLQTLRFDSDLSKRLGDLSFGNLRKLLLAEALTSGQQLIVIDEFTAGLDRHGSITVSHVVAQLAASGTTIILADQQDRPFPPGTRVYTIENSRLEHADVATGEDPVVEVRMRGPRSQLRDFTDTASFYGFEGQP